MPVTDDVKRNALIAAGYSPDQYEIDNDGNVFEIQKQSPAITNTPPSPLSTMNFGGDTTKTGNSSLETFGKTFAQEAPSALATGAGAAGGFALGTSTLLPALGLAPETGGLSMLIPFLTALLGGGAASYGTKKLQSMVEPESMVQNVEEAQQEHPTAATLGRLATIPLSGFRPSPKTLMEGAGAIPKLLTGMARTPQEINALRNIGTGAAIGAAGPIGNIPFTGQMPSMKDVLSGAATGALFNEPNAIGRAYGFHPTFAPNELPGIEDLGTESGNTPAQPLQTMPALTPEQLMATGGTPLMRGLRTTKGGLTKSMGDVMSGWKGDNFPSEEELNRMSNEGGPSNELETMPTERDKKIMDFFRAKQELNQQQEQANEEQRQLSLQKQKNDLQNTIQQNQILKTGVEQSVKPLVTTETGKDIMPDYTGVTEHDNLETDVESPADLANRKTEGFTDKYSEESPLNQEKKIQPDNPEVKALIDMAVKKSDDASITSQEGDEIQKVLANQVDWSKNPAIETSLRDKNFDSLDPDHWLTLQNLHNNILSKVVKPSEIPSNQPVKVTKPVVQKAIPRVMTPGKPPLSTTDFEASLAPKPAERITPEQSATIADLWKRVDDPTGNQRNTMNAIEMAYDKMPHDGQTVLQAMVEVLGRKGVVPGERFGNRLATRYSEGGVNTDFTKEITNQIKDKNIPTKPTSQWTELFKRFGLLQRNADVQEDGSIVNSLTGKPVAGQTRTFKDALQKSLIKLNPNKQAIDTAPHEMAHAFIDQLRNSPKPADRALVSRFEDVVKNHPDFEKINEARVKDGKEPWSPEEFIATEQGFEFLRRNLNLSGEKPLKTWWNDFWSHVKTKYKGNEATNEDYRRLLQYRFQNDAPFHDYYKTGINISGINAPRFSNQDESPLDKVYKPEEFPVKWFEPNGMNHDIDYNEFATHHDWAEHYLRDEPKVDDPEGHLKKQGWRRYIENPNTKTAYIDNPNAKQLKEAKDIAIEKGYLLKDHKDNTLYDPSEGDIHNQEESPLAKYIGEQEGFGDIPSMKLYNLQKDFTTPEGQKYVKGSTVSERLLKQHNIPYEDSVKNQDESPLHDVLMRAKGEGKTGYPFSLKELEKSKSWSREQYDKALSLKQELAKDLVYETNQRGGNMQRVEALNMLDKFIWEPEKFDAFMNVFKGRDADLFEQKFNRYKEIIQRENDLSSLNKDIESDKRSGNLPLNQEESSLHNQESPISVAAAQSNQRDIRTDEKSKLNYRTLSVTKPQLDKIRELGGKEGNNFADTVEKYYPLKDQTQAKYMYPILQAAKGLPKQSLDKVENILLREFRTKQDNSGLLKGSELRLYNAIRKSYLDKQNDQIAAKQPVSDWDSQGKEFKRLPKVDPFYHAMRIDPKVAEEITERPYSAKAQSLKDDFLKYQMSKGLSDRSAQVKLDSLLQAYDVATPNLTRFNANREAEGIGLPDSWLRKGQLLKSQNAYYNRVSADRAWHDLVETNPNVATSLKLKNDPYGKPYDSEARDISGIPQVRDLMDNITGESFHKDEAILKTLNRTAAAFMLGPLTNIHIAAGSLANSMQYLHPSEAIPAYTKAISNMAENWDKVLRTGYHKPGLDSVKDIFDTQNTGLEKLRAFASGVSNLSGREGMNHFTKTMLQGMGDFVVRARAIEANGGDREAIQLMRKLDPDWQQGKQYTGKDLDNLASVFASYIHGAHDTRTLPGWMLKDTAVQPFFSLASWNIAQTNAWMRSVWTPATKGNYTPLIMSTLGAAAGGYVVKTLREKLSDKKAPIPSLTEIVNSNRGLEHNIPNVAYNLMAMASYTGFAGILSVLGKAGMDITHKNMPQGAAFPLDELISNPTTRLAQLATAIANDPNMDYTKVGMKFVSDLVKDNFQLGRVIHSQLSNTGILGENAQYEKAVNTKNADLRRWKMAEGMPYEAQGMTSINPYIDMDEKSFKRTEDVGEAAKELPDLVREALRKSTGYDGVVNPNTLSSELNKLKGNSFQTMPSPEDEPVNFYHYYNFLRKTQGDDVAKQRLLEYMRKREINKAKTSMIPSV